MRLQWLLALILVLVHGLVAGKEERPRGGRVLHMWSQLSDAQKDILKSEGKSSDFVFALRRSDSSMEDVINEGDEASDRMDIANDADEENENGPDDNLLATQVNAIEVLATVRKMQDEIKKLNKEIEEENKKIQEQEAEAAQVKGDTVSDKKTRENAILEDKLKKQTIIEKIKEIKLKKENAKMKAIETQIKLRKLQNKNDDATSRQLGELDVALDLIAARRRKILRALNRQKTVTAERQRLALQFLQAKKANDAERAKLVQDLRQDRLNRIRQKKLDKQRQLQSALQLQKEAAQEAKNLLAHKTLVDQSNLRIAQKLQNINQKKVQASLNLRNRLVQQELAKLQRPLLASAGLQKQSPLSRLTVQEMTELLSVLDLERNAEILQSTNAKIAEKNKLVKSAQNLIKNAAQVALGEDNFQLTDSEVDDLLGIQGEPVLDPLGPLDPLDYDYPIDYDVDLEEILVNYDYEYDTPIVPAVPVVPNVAPVVPVAPVLHPGYVKPKPLPKPQSHSYQYFHQVEHAPKPVLHHNPPNHYIAVQYREKPPYHKPVEAYHPPPPPPPTPSYYQQPHHYKPAPYSEHEPHHPTHYTEHHGQYHAKDHNHDHSYYTPDKDPSHHVAHHDGHHGNEYYSKRPNYVHGKPVDEYFFYKEDGPYYEQHKHHKADGYYEHSYHEPHDHYYHEPGPPYHSQVSSPSLAQFQQEVPPLVDSTSGSSKNSLLRSIQDKLDQELDFGPSHHTRVVFGTLEPEPERHISRAEAVSGSTYHPRELRRVEDSTQGQQKSEFAGSDEVSTTHLTKKARTASFSELMSDFLHDKPLPFMQNKG